MVVVCVSLQLALVDYDPDTHDLKTTSLHYFEEYELKVSGEWGCAVLDSWFISDSVSTEGSSPGLAVARWSAECQVMRLSPTGSLWLIMSYPKYTLSALYKMVKIMKLLGCGDKMCHLQRHLQSIALHLQSIALPDLNCPSYTPVFTCRRSEILDPSKKSQKIFFQRVTHPTW